MADSKSDRRRSPRVAHPKFVVRIPSSDGPRSDYLKDLSEGGVFVGTSTQLPVGSTLQIELWPPNESKAMQLSARVLRIVKAGSPRFGGEAGLAVAFTSISADDARRIKAIIDANDKAAAPGAAASARLDQMERALAELTESRRLNQKLEAELDRLRAEMSGSTERIHQIEVESAFTKGLVGKLENQRGELETEVQKLKTELALAEKKLGIEPNDSTLPGRPASRAPPAPPEARATEGSPEDDVPTFAGKPVLAAPGSKPGRTGARILNPLEFSSGSADFFVDTSEMNLRTGVPRAPSRAAGLGFAMDASIIDGRKVYALFIQDLKGTTRLLPSPDLAQCTPRNDDDALLAELLEPAPTFAALQARALGRLPEESLRQLLYELYARALLDLAEP